MPGGGGEEETRLLSDGGRRFGDLVGPVERWVGGGDLSQSELVGERDDHRRVERSRLAEQSNGDGARPLGQTRHWNVSVPIHFVAPPTAPESIRQDSAERLREEQLFPSFSWAMIQRNVITFGLINEKSLKVSSGMEKRRSESFSSSSES